MISPVICIILLIHASKSETQTNHCKEMLQGYLTGQLSSALGSYQIEALKREFKGFADTMEKSMKEFKEQVKSDLKNGSGVDPKIGAVYIRWGKKSCPSTAQLVHSGYVGGSYITHTGAAVDPLCLPRNPEWGKYKDAVEHWRGYVYGSEYETDYIPLASVHNHNVPCAVCLLRDKTTTTVFPARKSCFRGWRLEYHGYLMAGYYGHKAGTMYTCIDKNPDTIVRGHADHNGYLFYPVESRCGSLNCPPYVEGRELTCAVCSAP